MSQNPFIEGASSIIGMSYPETDRHYPVLSVREIREQTHFAIARIIEGESERSNVSDIGQLQPNSINLRLADGKMLSFLNRLAAHPSTCESVIAIIKKPIDLNHISSQHKELFSNLATNLSKPEMLLALLPDEISPCFLPIAKPEIIVDILISIGLESIFWSRIQKPLPQLSSIDDSMASILSLLIAKKKYVDEIMSLLPAQLDLSAMTFRQYSVIVAIIRNISISEVSDRLPNKIDLSTISYHGARLLEILWHAEEKTAIIQRMPSIVNLDHLTKDAFIILEFFPFEFCDQKDIEENPEKFGGIDEKNIVIIPQEINLATISERSAHELIISFSEEDLVQRLPPNINTQILSAGALKLLLKTRRHEKTKNLIKSFLELSESSIQIPIPASELRGINTKVGPYLFEIIESFPIDYGSVIQLRSGWYRAELLKGGSRSHVFINPTNERVIFRTSDYTERSLLAYQDAKKLLPTHVIGQSYTELQPLSTEAGVKLNSRRNSYGFREVFAGASLDWYESYALPSVIMSKIDQQVAFIKLILTQNDIEHGHDKPMNFNVRFLLSSTDGSEKHVSFDLNVAIQVAIKHSWNLTPIVTLRDWDQSSSSPNNSTD